MPDATIADFVAFDVCDNAKDLAPMYQHLAAKHPLVFQHLKDEKQWCRGLAETPLYWRDGDKVHAQRRTWLGSVCVWVLNNKGRCGVLAPLQCMRYSLAAMGLPCVTVSTRGRRDGLAVSLVCALRLNATIAASLRNCGGLPHVDGSSV